ncbi:FHA domain protein [Rosistilla ulvae]|uniref:FHA domain protein n=1 Tax=Rosistilla ulvae TaxID=1930277 RepID=A0A517LXD1_9BACT|nr:FHA domain-containing protein [Rosistilla ulvae]QDS87283.1 FHA domain protein [Rosistilla ulvae]
MKTWTIGRNLLCDVVIDQPDVEDRHCLLRQTIGGFLLEDLGSRCGTFVDEHRITHPVIVSDNSRIVLGVSTPFVWPNGIDPQAIPQSTGGAKVYRVGRFPDNDLVLDRDMISGRHALLVVEGDRIMIEDLGSTNGTAVGTIDNRIGYAEVRERDRVFFGSFSIMVTHLLAMTRKSKPPETVIEQPVHAARTDLVSKASSRRGLLATAALLAALMAGWWMRPVAPQAPSDLLSSGNSPSTPEILPSEVLELQAAMPPPDQKADLLAARDKDQPSGPIPISEAADALFMVIVTGDSKQIAFHIGTAWLAASDRLVTSGTVVSAIKEQDASGFSHVQVVQTSTGLPFDIETVRLDAGLAEAQQKYAQGRQHYSELQAEIKALRLRGDSADRLDEARRESQEIIEAGLQSTSVRASLNVGWLQLAAAVPDAKPARLADTAELAVGQILHMHAAPFQVDNPAWDSAVPADPHGVVVRVEERIASTVDTAPDRWLMSMATSGPPQNYVGSPILTQQGNVVAMFSRPLGDQTETTEEASLLFEAVSVPRLAESTR